VLYMGDVTVYTVNADAGATLEALLANSGSGDTRVFEIGDRVQIGWAADAGHFLEG
jgi:hypothetical protein